MKNHPLAQQPANSTGHSLPPSCGKVKKDLCCHRLRQWPQEVKEERERLAEPLSSRTHPSQARVHKEPREDRTDDKLSS